MHGAGAALGDTAAILGAGETELLAQHPQKRRARVGVVVEALAVDVEDSHPGLRRLEVCWQPSQSGRSRPVTLLSRGSDAPRRMLVSRARPRRPAGSCPPTAFPFLPL